MCVRNPAKLKQPASNSCRYDFIEFIRNGGRRPQPQPDSLTRQGSIELVSEPSDLGQALDPPPPQNAGADPPQHSSQTVAHQTGSAPDLEASDAAKQQQQQQLIPPLKLAPIQTVVGHALLTVKNENKNENESDSDSDDDNDNDNQR